MEENIATVGSKQPTRPSIPNDVSFEEFEAKHLADMEARLQAKRSQKSTPKPKAEVASLGPIPLSTPQSASQFMPHFNHLCQTKGITAIFEIYTLSGQLKALRGSTGGSPGFGAKVTFAGNEVKDDGPYWNKKEAKEHVARKALEILKEVEVKAPDVDEENWIGMLGEYAQSIPSALPRYEPFQLGEKFSCEVTLSAHPSERFGNRDTPWSSKKVAKASAAKEAITWLRENGHLDGDRKKSKGAGPTDSPVPASPIPLNSPPAANSPVSMGTSSVQQVITFAKGLDLSPPEYKLAPGNEQVTGFYDCFAYFPNDGKMPDEIGSVRNIHGKKNAKEECAKGVLDLLSEMQAERTNRLAALLKAAEAQGATK